MSCGEGGLKGLDEGVDFFWGGMGRLWRGVTWHCCMIGGRCVDCKEETFAEMWSKSWF